MPNRKPLAISPEADAPALSSPDREELLLRYWRRGDLTPLAVANSLARSGSGIAFTRAAAGFDATLG